MRIKKTIQPILFIWMLTLALQSLSAQEGIGTNSPDASAVLDLTSTNRGFLPPRMTYAQMTAIVSPTAGLTVYCTDCEPVGVHYYDGSYFLHTQTGATSGNLSSLDDTALSYTGSSTLNYGFTYTDAHGITVSIPYTGWGGNAHNPIAFNSTNVWGLTATLSPTTLTAGSGNATFIITGTPDANGTPPPLFNVSLGGLSATFTQTIYVPSTEVAAGLENGTIPDAQLSASSFLSGFEVPRGRLNTTGNSWTHIGNSDPNPWYQVDLGQVEIISAVATQGRESYPQWVKSYRIEYSNDGVNFTSYNGGAAFTGNTDQNTIVKNNFTPTINARYIRFILLTNQDRFSARFEVYILR